MTGVDLRQKGSDIADVELIDIREPVGSQPIAQAEKLAKLAEVETVGTDREVGAAGEPIK